MGQLFSKQAEPPDTQSVDLSEVNQIISQQSLLFDGYWRMEILPHFQSHPLMSNDVKIVGEEFDCIDLFDYCESRLWIDYNDKEEFAVFAVQGLAEELIKAKQFFVAHRILHYLLNCDLDNYLQAFHHEMLAKLLTEQDAETHKDEIISHYKTAINLDPQNCRKRLYE